MDKEEIELKRLEKIQAESNQEATERIGRELIEAKKLEERRNAVMNYFFELTGITMSVVWFNEYNYLFNRAEAGYNIKSFIRTKEKEIEAYKKEITANFKE